MKPIDITLLLRAADGFDFDSNLRADAADLIDRLREALRYYACDCEPGDCMEAFRGELCGMAAVAALMEDKE